MNAYTMLRRAGLMPAPDYKMVLEPDAVVATGGTGTADKTDKPQYAGTIIGMSTAAWDKAYATAVDLSEYFRTFMRVRLKIDSKPFTMDLYESLTTIGGKSEPTPYWIPVRLEAPIVHSWKNDTTANAPSLWGSVSIYIVTEAGLRSFLERLGSGAAG